MTSKRDLLIEAIRRLDTFHANEDPLKAWSGLGTRTEYKPVLDAGLMEWVHVPVLRAMGWLRLTEAGLAETLRIRSEYVGQMEFVGYTPINDFHWHAGRPE